MIRGLLSGSQSPAIFQFNLNNLSSYDASLVGVWMVDGYWLRYLTIFEIDE